MGEYANDAFERDFHDYLDRWEGGGRPKRNPVEFKTFEIKGVVRETDKAWLVEMSGGAKRWFPKSKCTLTIGFISVPEWLCSKILEIEYSKEKYRQQ